MKKILVLSDRDGTINLDEDYYLGSNPKWQEQVRFLEGVEEGISLLNTLPNSYFYILTNQSGVALEGERFRELTEERMHEVNRYIISLLAAKDLRVDGYFACSFIDERYARRASARGEEVNSKYIVNDHPDMKPRLGMIEKALKAIDVNSDKDCRLFVIGDRASDVEMGLRAGGVGILVESVKTRQLGDTEKVRQMDGEWRIAETFFAACQLIAREVSSEVEGVK